MDWWSSEDSSTNRSIELVVWPTRDPVANGTLYDLDTFSDTNNELTLVGQDFLTVRVSENATDTGYEWEDPLVYPCLELVTNNDGNFTTGYK